MLEHLFGPSKIDLSFSDAKSIYKLLLAKAFASSQQKEIYEAQIIKKFNQEMQEYGGHPPEVLASTLLSEASSISAGISHAVLKNKEYQKYKSDEHTTPDQIRSGVSFGLWAHQIFGFFQELYIDQSKKIKHSLSQSEFKDYVNSSPTSYIMDYYSDGSDVHSFGRNIADNRDVGNNLRLIMKHCVPQIIFTNKINNDEGLSKIVAEGSKASNTYPSSWEYLGILAGDSYFKYWHAKLPHNSQSARLS